MDRGLEAHEDGPAGLSAVYLHASSAAGKAGVQSASTPEPNQSGCRERSASGRRRFQPAAQRRSCPGRAGGGIGEGDAAVGVVVELSVPA
jgi:hypothetical protein